MMDFGTDVSAFPSIGAKARMVSGVRNYLEALVRRWTTPRGALFYAPDYGRDLRAWLNKEDTAANRFSLAVEAAAEAEADPRTISADAEVVAVVPGSAYKLRVDLETTEGPLSLILAVSAVTVEVLNADAN